jgi:hypothetical protein
MNMDISNVGLQDFKDLFLRKKSGHLTEYVYLFDDTYYEKLLEYDEYYNGSVEKNILQSQSGRIDLFRNSLIYLQIMYSSNQIKSKMESFSSISISI